MAFQAKSFHLVLSILHFHNLDEDDDEENVVIIPGPPGRLYSPDLPQKRPIPSDKGYPNCGEGYYDAQGLGKALDYCRWVGNGGCRNEPSWWSCALAGFDSQYSDRGEYTEPNCDKIPGKNLKLYFFGLHIFQLDELDNSDDNHGIPDKNN